MKTIFKRTSIILSFLWACGAFSADARTFYVAPDGSDTADGLTVGAPFQTLEKARDAVRAKLASGETGDITVKIRGGRYLLTKTVVFGLQDGAQKEGQQIIYEAFPGETPVFTSLMPVDNWQLADSLPEYVPAKAEGALFRADISAIAAHRKQAIAEGYSALPDWRVKILYQGDDRQLPPAGSERFNPEVMHKAPQMLGGGRGNEVFYPEGAFRKYTDFESAELKIIPRFDWSMNILPVKSIDEKSRVCQTRFSGTYPLETTWKWRLRPCAWFENVPWGLKPGRWLLNAQEEALYYWSEDGSAPKNTGISCGLMEYIFVKGTSNMDAPTDVPVKGLIFRGLTFMQGSRYTFPDDYKSRRWQHDWAGYDEASALLRFRGAQDCLVEKCRFINSGATGVRMDLHAQNITVRENEFSHLGESGVVISGYGPGTKDVNHGNRIENNWFHHGSEHYLHAPAIMIVQSGNNDVRNNLIHDFNYAGIVISGVRRFVPEPNVESQFCESQLPVRWDEIGEKKNMEFPETIPFMTANNNRVEQNEIFRIMEGLGDGCAIYLSCAGTNNLIAENYIHHVRGDQASTLRSDDAQWHVTYRDNVMYKNTGHGIILKGPNKAVNNFLIDQEEHFVMPKIENSICMAIRMGPPEGIVFEHNVIAQLTYNKPALYYITPTPGHKRGGFTMESVKAADVDSNVFWWKKNPSEVENWLAETRNTFGYDGNSLVTDPQFADPANGDFSFRSKQLADLGIHQLHPERSGLTGDFRAKVYKPSAGIVTLLLDGVSASSDRIPFTGPVNVSLSVDNPNAVVRYTLDGSEPDEQSLLYAGPFVMNHPAMVRARAFETGKVDRLGTRVELLQSNSPLFETFDGIPYSMSMQAPREGENGVNLCSAPIPKGESVCLDNPGTGMKNSPKIYYQFLSGNDMSVEFDLWMDSGAELLFQWLEDPNFSTKETTVRLLGNGAVTLFGSDMKASEFPLNQWVHIEVLIPAGDRQASHYPAKLLINGKPVAAFGREFPGTARYIRQLNLFSTNHKTPAAIYLDNIRISADEDGY